MTRAAWVDQRLREAILGGRLRPGDPLVISTLADSHRRLKELTIEGDAPAAADELRRHLDRTIGAPGILVLDGTVAAP